MSRATAWRRWLGLEHQTAAEKRAARNGISMFFGALIGANLGALDRLALGDYVLLIAIVCLIVLYMHLATVAAKRWSTIGYLLALVAGLYLLLVHDAGARMFEGPRPGPQIFVTICFWLASIAIVELRPVSATPAD